MAALTGVPLSLRRHLQGVIAPVRLARVAGGIADGHAELGGAGRVGLNDQVAAAVQRCRRTGEIGVDGVDQVAERGRRIDGQGGVDRGTRDVVPCKTILSVEAGGGVG